ncbi:MAG: ABC transporter ATP-binding protein [Pseudomonadota bacterium]
MRRYFDKLFTWFEGRVAPFPEEGAGAPPEKLPAFCWYYSKDAAPWLIATSVTSAAIAVGEVFLFGFLGQLVDWLATTDREGFLARESGNLALMGFVVVVALPALALVNALITHQTLLGNLPMSARWRMHRRLLGQSFGFFADEFAGRIATKVMQTALAVRETVMKLLDILVYVAVYFATMVGLVAASDWRLAAPLLVWLAAYVAIISYFVPRLQKTAERQADARSEMTGRIVDSYTNIQTVKLFAHAGREETYARDSMNTFLGTVHPQMRLVSQFYAIIYLANCVMVFALIAIAIGLWLGQSVTVGAIAAAAGLSLRIGGMSQWIMWEVAALFENLGVIHDGMAMLNKPVAVKDAEDAPDLQVTAGDVRFEDVTFHYGKSKGVIEGLSLRVAPGEKIGLVGRSGAGKTTLTNLLLRFYDVEGGRVSVDGQDVSSVTQDSLRRAVGVVTQDSALLHRSIRDNIAYGRPDASDDEIADAVARADAADFIDDLVDQKGRKGLDAHVGERGVKLSGGQRQRIAIARTFLKDAPILILDEATSALDSEVEAAIQEHLFSLMRGKTVIAIAHRLSTIAQMDRLVCLDAGRIVEEGPHDELVRSGGLYADLWTRQSGGFLAADDPLAAPAAE